MKILSITLLLYILLIHFPIGETTAENGREIQTATDELLATIELPEDLLNVEEDILRDLTDEQKDWYRKFHEGVLFFDGWQAIALDIINKYDDREKQVIKRKVQWLGILIGTEWSKENNVRKINNKMLEQWGDEIRSAMKVNKLELTRVLDDISTEVEQILQDKLTSSGNLEQK